MGRSTCECSTPLLRRDIFEKRLTRSYTSSGNFQRSTCDTEPRQLLYTLANDAFAGVYTAGGDRVTNHSTWSRGCTASTYLASSEKAARPVYSLAALCASSSRRRHQQTECHASTIFVFQHGVITSGSGSNISFSDARC